VYVNDVNAGKKAHLVKFVLIALPLFTIMSLLFLLMSSPLSAFLLLSAPTQLL